MNAIWYDDYDSRTDKLYKRPCCPECKAPIGKFLDGKYRCYSCGEIITVADEKMKNWLKLREETKVEFLNCHVLKLPDGGQIGCGGKKCVETHYNKNPVTLEWQTTHGKCKKCGQTFMV